MSFRDNLQKILKRHAELSNALSSGEPFAGDQFAANSKEYSDLTPIVERIQELLHIEQEMASLQEIMQDSTADAEMRTMANDEYHALGARQPEVERAVQIALLPKDEADERNAILEVRAGTGGEEAALFAASLFRMYQRYAESHGWNFEIMEISDTGIGGYKEASASISGKGVFARLKFESGVHRVQRVPETEASGRVHTSAATVAVLPEAEEVDIVIQDKDLRIDVFRSSGPGGQSVNTTDSAVRIVHLPTGVVVQQQDEKSQHKNRAKAMKILRARLYDMQRSEQEKTRAADRKGQIGSGDRSERIRTYNFPQGRVTDHRINVTLYKIQEMVGEGKIDELIDALITEDEARRLSEAL